MKDNSKNRTEIQIALAQFFTPNPIAFFMAKMFRVRSGKVNLLDPGAGHGILGITLTEQLNITSEQINGTYVEFDDATFKVLKRNLLKLKHSLIFLMQQGLLFRKLKIVYMWKPQVVGVQILSTCHLT